VEVDYPESSSESDIPPSGNSKKNRGTTVHQQQHQQQQQQQQQQQHQQYQQQYPQQQQQRPYEPAGVGAVERRHRRSFWCRTSTLATISALLATMFCVTCAVFLYYNCEYDERWNLKMPPGDFSPNNNYENFRGYGVGNISAGTFRTISVINASLFEFLDGPLPRGSV